MKKKEDSEFIKELCKLGICTVLTLALLLCTRMGFLDGENVRHEISRNSFSPPGRLWEKTVAFWKEERQNHE